MIKKIAIAAAILGIVFYSIDSSLQSESEVYVRNLRQFRRDKNRAFRLSPESPLTAAQKEQFDSLRYYSLGDYWGVTTGEVERIPRPDTVELAMSDNSTEKYLRFGIVKFTEADPVPGQYLKLTLYKKASGNDSTLFVPFTDLTNGHETYGGGRYLDVPMPASDADQVKLDFNRAYNPYCAYNNAFSCPMPPPENRLKVHISAGEKAFHD